MACPQVSGLAALVMSMRDNLTPAQIKTLIEATVQKKTQYSGLASSGGLIDVNATISALMTGTIPTTQSTTPATTTTLNGCGSPQWATDKYCDDENNNAGCNWDGGACCNNDQ